jgi:hypothetical protein
MNANSLKQNTPDNPKAACEKFINELDKLYYPWYSRKAAWHYRLTSVLQFVAIISAFAAAILASIFQPEQLASFGWAHITLIVLPALASLASTLMVQMRIRELLPLRERGRREFQKLIAQGEAKFAAASSPAEYTEINLWLVEQADAIELEQTDEFVRGVPGPNQ